MKLHELKETRAARIAEMRTISDGAEGELGAEARARFDQLDAEVRGLNARIADGERLAEYDRIISDGQPVTGPQEARALDRYSVGKALAESLHGRLTGVEAECHQELSRGRGEVRGVLIPAGLILGGERRALTTTTPGAGPGSNLIATDLGAMTDRRRPALKIESMGATVMRGLTGTLDLPRMTGSGSASWVAEHGAATRSDASFGKVSMGPKTVTAEYELSRKMQLQSSTAIEPVLRADLAYLLAQSVDRAAIIGGGTNEPVGILANPTVEHIVSAGPWGQLVDATADLIGAIEREDVTGTSAFLAATATIAEARKVKDGDGLPIGLPAIFHGQRVEHTTQMPIPFGTGTYRQPLIYGEWSSLYLGFWSGIDVLLNPYHGDVASRGGTLLHAFLDCDVVVRHPEAFKVAEL